MSEESKKVKGIVESISEKNGGIKIGEDWYNTTDKTKELASKTLYKKEVELTLDKDNKIESLKLLSSNPSQTPKEFVDSKDNYWKNKEKRDIEIQPKIIRQSCIKAACVLFSEHGSSDIDAKFIIGVAKEFEKYCSIAGE